MTVRVEVRTLGCKVNRVESEQIASRLLGSGAELVESAAQVIVVNTCTVTGEADAKARKAVRRALAEPSAPVVVVTGCLASLDAGALSELGERVIVEPDKSLVPGRVAAVLDIALDSAPGSVAPRGAAFRTRSPLKIQDGCDSFCSYCIVPHARGVPRSVPLAELRSAASALAEGGVSEIVLTGINLGRYDDDGADLAAVVSAVAASGVARVRLSSIEPLDLGERLLETLASTPAVCEHIHVPLQSGSDAVLSAMGRRYSAEQFARRIDAARDALPNLAVTTDVIAGFPGETEHQALETQDFCEQIGFSKLHVFRYSERTGTPAATMAGSVPKETRAVRAAALRDLGDRLRARHVGSRAGERVEVLVEKMADGRASGTTRDYLPVEFAAQPGVSVGDLVWVTYEPHEPHSSAV